MRPHTGMGNSAAPNPPHLPQRVTRAGHSLTHGLHKHCRGRSRRLVWGGAAHVTQRGAGVKVLAPTDVTPVSP